jgi:ABC-2 type transport system permease protein
MPRVDLLIEDRDDSLLSGLLISAIQSDDVTQYVELRQVGEEGQALIEQGEGSALLRIPEGFGEDLLDGRPLTLELIRNPAQGILPEIAEQGLTVFVDLLSSASRVLREPLDGLAPLLEADEAPSELQVAAIAVAFQRAIERSSGRVFPPTITFEVIQLDEDEDEGAGGSGGFSTALVFLMVLPGISVWALFMLGDIAMRDLITEREDGTLRRQLAGPITSTQLVLAKALFTMVLSLISLVLLATIGRLAASGPIDLAGFALLSFCLVIAVTGFSAIMYGATRTQRQGATISSMLLLVFAFMGGAFVSIDSLPDTVRRLAPLSPFYWGTTGYAKLIGDGAGLIEILPNAGVLAGIGMVLLVAGGIMLNSRIRRDLA